SIENGVILGGNGPLVGPLPHGSGKKRTLFKPSKVAWVGNLPEQTNDREIPTDMSRCKDRYFIVKSLSDEDIQTSVRLGYWATQFKNEAVLNRAFENSDNVYLIFSANKSGQFFGYGRMEAPIEASAEIPEITWASVDSCSDATTTRGKWGRPFQIRWLAV
ncbi:hypothetical protein HK405_013159, partial [Cladochytrium tenue]